MTRVKQGTLLPAASEAEFTAWIVDLAHLRGWRVEHYRPGRTADGSWRTAVQFDAKGAPDLKLYKAGHRPLHLEVKRLGGKPTTEQESWIALLLQTGCRAAIVQPRDGDRAWIRSILEEADDGDSAD